MKTTDSRRNRYRRLLAVGMAVALILVTALPALGRQRAYGSSRVD